MASDHCSVPKKVLALEGKKIVNISVGSAHVLALTNDGLLYGWGSNYYQQICPPSITRDPIIPTPILSTPPTLKVGGMACGNNSSVVWCYSSSLDVAGRIPFVVDLSEQTFRLIDQLLCVVCGVTQTISSTHPPSQEAECIVVASLNLLRLQLHAIIVNNIIPKSVGLLEGSRLLSSLKTRILNLAGGAGILKTIQEGKF